MSQLKIGLRSGSLSLGKARTHTFFDSNTRSMLFSLAGGGADDVHEIGGSPTDVVGALASFGQKVEDAGDDAMTDDFELRPEWLESVQKS